MAWAYTNAVKNARMQAVITAIGSGGKLIIGTAGMGKVLVTFDLDNPAGSDTNGVTTFSGFPMSATASAGDPDTAAEAKITDGTNDIATGLTVGTSASDINLDSVSITAGQTVSITSAKITHG